MPTRTFYMDRSSGQLMIVDYALAQAGLLAAAAGSPSNYLDYVRFHTGLLNLQILGSVTASSLSYGSFSRNTFSYDPGKKSGTQTYPVPTQQVQNATVGTHSSGITPDLFMVEYSSEIYQGGFNIESTTSGDWFRRFFPTYTSSTRTVTLTCQAIALRTNMPAITLSNIKVYLVG